MRIVKVLLWMDHDFNLSNGVFDNLSLSISFLLTFSNHTRCKSLVGRRRAWSRSILVWSFLLMRIQWEFDENPMRIQVHTICKKYVLFQWWLEVVARIIWRRKWERFGKSHIYPTPEKYSPLLLVLYLLLVTNHAI